MFQSRLILDLRALYFSDTHNSELPCLSIAYPESNHRGGQSVATVRFAVSSSAIVGNSGAPLEVRRQESNTDGDEHSEQGEGGAVFEGKEWPVFARDPFGEGMEMEAKLESQYPGRSRHGAEA